MTVETVAGDFRQFRALDTHSFEESLTSLTRDICPHSLVTQAKNQLRTVHDRIVMSSGTMNWLQYGAEVRIENACLVDGYLVVMPISGRCEISFGGTRLPIGNGFGAIVGPGSRFQIDADAATRTLVWRMSASAIERAAYSARLVNAGCGHFVGSQLPLHGGAGERFVRTLRFTLTELGRGGDVAPLPPFSDRLEDLLILSLLETGSFDGLAAARLPVVPGCIRRVEQYVAANISENIELEDLVAVSRVSKRTLHRAFQSFHFQPPMAYVRQVRLRGVRADLLNAERSASVTSIQANWGVTQAGRFSAEYQRTFGELPRETLRIARASRTSS